MCVVQRTSTESLGQFINQFLKDPNIEPWIINIDLFLPPPFTFSVGFNMVCFDKEFMSNFWQYIYIYIILVDIEPMVHLTKVYDHFCPLNMVNIIQ